MFDLMSIDPSKTQGASFNGQARKFYIFFNDNYALFIFTRALDSAQAKTPNMQPLPRVYGH